MSTRSFATDQEEDRRVGILRPFVHDIGAHRFERRRFMQINDALGSRLAADPTRMIEADPDRNASSAISQVGEMNAEHFTRTKATIEHQTDYREITSATHLFDQTIDLFVQHGAWQAMNLPEPHGAAGRRS